MKLAMIGDIPVNSASRGPHHNPWVASSSLAPATGITASGTSAVSYPKTAVEIIVLRGVIALQRFSQELIVALNHVLAAARLNHSVPRRLTLSCLLLLLTRKPADRLSTIA